MSRKDRIEAMLKRAYELASQGHRPQMIEAVLAANGFPEAAEFIEQHALKRELIELADEARKSTLAGNKSLGR
jgi:replicative DNA helicase